MKQIQIPVNGDNISRYEFYIEEEFPNAIITWLTDWLTKYIESGAKFSNGQIFQYGWSVLQCQLQNNCLRLLAPDFQSMPIEWIPNITKVLHILMEHKYVPESFELDMDVPSLEDTAVVGRGFEELPTIMVRSSRSENNPQDSGWFVGSFREDIDNNDPSNLELMTLYEVVLCAPHTLRYLSMPQGTQIVFESNSPVIFFDEQLLNPKAGSYLANKLALES
ncbi:MULTISPECIES: DUF2185 domain-containing protein [unclassified Leptolyngbya]|uniref:immunity protein Imm33 domain-containing protein n=1 Tax=unclassified Leptolyngbya TaxID=2650499 RepID=UPI0016855087|nr:MULTISPECIES: DUF2185 domain-containing protein [unclassified Leptolyngbya]MBD1912953.1 DUF2185 domain-containing protein [Leptolyngbya sp. FACHB-8]MBD2154718.1 DUF2185 domain-containing protein [Leptolyngbya sp. FACHB-16]